MDLETATRLTAENCDRLLADADLIADGLDNFETRFVLNDYTIANQKALVADAPATDLTHIGILNTVPPIVASLQTTEILRYFMEGSPRMRKCNILHFDAWRRQFGKLEFRK